MRRGLSRTNGDVVSVSGVPPVPAAAVTIEFAEGLENGPKVAEIILIFSQALADIQME